MGADIAIDLGTTRTRIYVQGAGVVIDEPTIVAVDIETDQIVAVGEEAYSMLGRVSKRIAVVYPLEGGAISDFYLVEEIISRFFRKVSSNKIVMPRAVACVPGDVTDVEKRAVVNSISAAGVRKVCLIDEPVAAAMGAGVDISDAHGCIVADIGGGTTDIAIISLGGIAVSKSIKVAGNKMDDDIIKYIRRTYSLHIGKRMAEDLKKAIGCVYPQPETTFYTIKGRDAVTGLPRMMDMTSEELMDVLEDSALQIVKQIQAVLEGTPPELAGDIFSDGIIITGGLSQLRGFAELIEKKTKLKVRVAQNPTNCVILGAGEAIKYIGALENKAFGVMNPLTSEY